MGVPVKINTLYPQRVCYPPTQKFYVSFVSLTPNVLARPVMSRSSKVNKVVTPSGTNVPDDFGVFGKVFRVPKPLMDKQVYLIERAE